MERDSSPVLADIDLTESILAAAFEVHTALGPGLDERTYERALCVELRARSIEFEYQPRYPIHYKGVVVGACKPDLVVENRVIVELKACDELTRLHKAQVVKYLRHTKLQTALLLNFNTISLKSGIRRLTLKVGWPRAVAHPGLPQIRTCRFPASGSSVHGFAT